MRLDYLQLKPFNRKKKINNEKIILWHCYAKRNNYIYIDKIHHIANLAKYFAANCNNSSCCLK
jgi:hypothetical protein